MNGGPSTLANTDIISLVNATLDPSVITSSIVACPKVTFDLSVAGLLALAGAKVSGEIIRVMQTKQAQQP